ncbi:hypothetical protein QBC46DRAFT_420333 [Diplogelasinospora grovesii]|uniref:Uncharacterized protein n=1 Tax=Diplogelasinospora grovesii TaxID=303347 RepID=A0AAN6MZP2_9PEZI|nr:hypothetical protein QBC46DRAFT_420333 [Diplogelasinospora grovesii]
MNVRTDPFGRKWSTAEIEAAVTLAHLLPAHPRHFSTSAQTTDTTTTPAPTITPTHTNTPTKNGSSNTSISRSSSKSLAQKETHSNSHKAMPSPPRSDPTKSSGNISISKPPSQFLTHEKSPLDSRKAVPPPPRPWSFFQTQFGPRRRLPQPHKPKDKKDSKPKSSFRLVGLNKDGIPQHVEADGVDKPDKVGSKRVRVI